MKKRNIILISVAIIVVIIAIVIAVVLSNNSNKNKEVEKQETGAQSTQNRTEQKTETTSNQTEQKNTETTNEQENAQEQQKTNNKEEETMTYEQAAEKQMAMPQVGETIATIHVKNYGDITVKFFKDVAPKAVENFITHAKDGYYDGVIFHRVINEFMIQGGDPEETGYGGESIWGQGFGTELDESLVPYRGSLCMAMSRLPNSIGSQFFITQAHYSERMASMLKQYGYPDGLIESYKKYGGYLSLYMQYTVFGQVIDGMDVVDKIAAVETNSSDKPLSDVVIESIDVTEYKG